MEPIAYTAAYGWLGSFWLLIAIPLASASVLLLLIAVVGAVVLAKRKV